MIIFRLRSTVFVCAVLGWFGLTVLSAQMLNLTEGVRTETTLTDTTVMMTGRSELHLTHATTPFAGSVVHLNSPDAWVAFPNIRPATVAASHLAQIRVNGAVASSGVNVRVAQFERGTMVIPHGPSFQPLEAFAGPDFTGQSMTFTPYQYYNTTGTLGVLHRNISSFRLKRGYMATMTTQANGTGNGRVYVAQDGDLEIGRLPSSLNDAVVFVRVLPWRWVSKKGSCDVPADTVNAHWFYNWANDRNSTLNWEYVPIRQQRYWPDYPTNKPDSTHLLGFNEPDNPVEDSYKTLGNGSITTALDTWPGLLATGLRVGSPAVTDGGLNWLYSFMDQAAARNLRVDYVAVHFYRCGFSAQQLYDWLYDIHIRTGGKPLWITEFNNGADWTNCADPSYQENANRIREFIQMLEAAPFVERYALYSRVEYMRQLTYDSGGLTPAGEVYRNQASSLGYRQEMPATGTRGIARLPMDGSVRDVSGFSNHGLAASAPAYRDSPRGRALVFDGANNHVHLPYRVAVSSTFTFAAWVYWDGGPSWQRIFDFGSDTANYLYLTPSSSAGTLRFGIRNSTSDQFVQHTAALPVGQWSHVAVTIGGGTTRLYLNGTQVGSVATTLTPAQLTPVKNYLGKSQWPSDPLFRGQLDEVHLADYALSAAQIGALMAGSAPTFNAPVITGGTATQGQPFTGTLAGTATGTAGALTFSKVSGPAWLQVAADGTLSGTPGPGDSGEQQWTVRVTDATGLVANTLLSIELPNVNANGIWLADVDGEWSDPARWSGGLPANGAGFSADFSTLDITADRVVTLDLPRALGTARFGDTTGTQSWTLGATGDGVLLLDSGSTSVPTVTVNQNTATLAAPLQGTLGLAKAGTGTLVLAAENTVSGPLQIDTNSTSLAQGVVRAAHPGALESFTSIAIRNNNSGSSTLELDGSSGEIHTTASISLAGRNADAPAIRNVAGENTLAGPLSIGVGGGNYRLRSDAGRLVLGAFSSAASGVRTLTLQGDGDFEFAGIVANGSAAPLHLVKEGAGRLLLSARTTFTGNLTINAGTVSVLDTGALYAGAWNNTAVLTVAAGGVLELDRWGYGINDATYRTQALGGLSYNPARFILNGGTVRYLGDLDGAPQNPAEQPYGPGFTIGAAGATLEAGIAGRTWLVKFDERGSGNITSSAGGALTLGGPGTGIQDKVLPGAGGLRKVGPGDWTLTRTNTYTGPTTVEAGRLTVTGSVAAGAVQVAADGELGGTGTLAGPVTITGRLAPGTPAAVGRLTLTGAVTLAPESRTVLRLRPAESTHDVLAVSGALTLAGTLEISSEGGPLALGSTFRVIEAASAATGTFATHVLPDLGAALAWDTGTLATDGTLRIVAAPLSGYAAWIAGQTGVSADARAATDDPDSDGLANMLEWALGGDPLVADGATVGPRLVTGSLTTEQFPAAVAGKTYLRLEARVRRELPGAVLTAQAANSLEALPAAAPESATPLPSQPDERGDPAYELRAWVHPTPVEDAPGGRAFLRLKLTIE